MNSDLLFVVLMSVAGLCLLGASYHIVMFFVVDMPAWRRLVREGRRRGWMR